MSSLTCRHPPKTEPYTMTAKKVSSVALLLSLVLALAGNAMGAGDVHREFYPHAPIDPAKGVAGDYSGTYRYWKDEQALGQNQAWIGHPEHQWKLNWKFMDLDRVEMHPGHIAVDEGQALVKRWAAREPAFLTCLGGGKKDLRGVAAAYPRYDEKLKRVLTVEALVEHCAKTAMWEDIKQGSPPNNKVSLYVKSLSAGMPLKVDLSAKPMMDAYKRGEELFHTKVGQLNFACASCHTPGSVMGHKLRGETPNTPFGDAAHFPTYRTPTSQLESMQQRFNLCLKQMRSVQLKPGDPVFLDLEIFMTVLSNGYPISVPSAR